jgi:hypothetical protein
MLAQHRSSTTAPSTGFADSDTNGTSNSLAAPWGNTIWTFKPEASKLRDYGSHGTIKQSTSDEKSGSSLLLKGSQAWGSRPNVSSSRSFTDTRQLDTKSVEQRQPTTGSSYQVLSPIENKSPTSTRPPTINLTNSNFPTRAGRKNGFSVHENKPPTLYTKFTAADPAIDSARTISPTDTRTLWATTSRDPSQPPSRHSNHEPFFPETAQSVRNTPANSRNHSLTSPRNMSYSSFQNGVDHIVPQLGQMSFGQNGHAAALRKASEPRYAHNSQRTLQYPPKFNSLSFNHKDDIEENDPLGMSYIVSEDYTASQDDHSRFSNIRFGQVPAQSDYRHDSFSTTGGALQRSQDFTALTKMSNDWVAYAEEMGLGRELSGLSEQQLMLDPRVQQMMAFKTQYQHALYNPYALQNGIQPNGSASYYPMYPMGIAGLDNSMPPRETLVSDGVQSTKLYDFKNAGKNNKRWELSDIFDHIAEFAGDQYGSRFIQTKLETANSDEKERVFREIEPNSIPLMTDVFGNYVIQKFFDHGHQEHKKLLANKMRGQVLNLSLQMYGCRVVQKALEHILVEQQAALVGELENHVLKCVKDQNGNHVIQKAIERCAPETIGFIYHAFLGQVQHLSLHPYGCRVIQRCLERPEFFPAKPEILTELHVSMQQGMIADQYGNYVVQHVVQKGSPEDKDRVFKLVIIGLEGYSKHKFASNVVEKCIEYSYDAWRRQVVNVLTAADQRRSEGDTTLISMIKDNFGNYVIRTFRVLS